MKKILVLFLLGFCMSCGTNNTPPTNNDSLKVDTLKVQVDTCKTDTVKK